MGVLADTAASPKRLTLAGITNTTNDKLIGPLIVDKTIWNAGSMITIQEHDSATLDYEHSQSGQQLRCKPSAAVWVFRILSIQIELEGGAGLLVVVMTAPMMIKVEYFVDLALR